MECGARVGSSSNYLKKPLPPNDYEVVDMSEDSLFDPD